MKTEQIFQRLDLELANVENLLQRYREPFIVSRPAVSAWSVGQHLDHSLLVVIRICALLLEQQPQADYGPNLVGRLLLLLGSLPRGRAQAPEAVLPRECSVEQLESKLDQARTLLDRIRSNSELLQSRQRYFKHFIFGGMNPKQAVRLIQVHTRHHLRIVEDLLEN